MRELEWEISKLQSGRSVRPNWDFERLYSLRPISQAPEEYAEHNDNEDDEEDDDAAKLGYDEG